MNLEKTSLYIIVIDHSLHFVSINKALSILIRRNKNCRKLLDLDYTL